MVENAYTAVLPAELHSLWATWFYFIFYFFNFLYAYGLSTITSVLA